MIPTNAESVKGHRVDRYELQELIGEGGMGAVYRAIDTRLGRTVALKTVISNRVSGGMAAELRARFMREALAASKVEHRNVVQVMDFGVTEDGTPYLVMEFLRGTDLGDMLQKSRAPLSIDHVADIMLAVCAALRACHQNGVVHRDLKPSNIFLAETDTGPEIKVVDFGVSKAAIAGDLTQEGQILGTPQYMSPEQVNGKVGPESDQYALGVLLYVCLTRKLPFEEHQNFSLLRAIDMGRFPSPRVHRPDIPPKLEAIILRAMHTNPAERFDSVHALGQALWAFASNRGKLEWRNFYFPTPAGGADQGTFRGVVAPTAVDDVNDGAGVTPGHRRMDRTALLSEDGTPAPRGATPASQRYVSTKLASPSSERNGPSEIIAAESMGNGMPVTGLGRPRRSAPALAVAAILLVGGAGVAFWRFHRDAPVVAGGTPTVSVTSTLAKEPEPRLPPPSPPATQAPRVVEPPSSHEVVRPPDAAHAPELEAKPPEHQPVASSPKKKAGGKKKHGTTPDESPKIHGLDQNGIGIPND